MDFVRVDLGSYFQGGFDVFDRIFGCFDQLFDFSFALVRQFLQFVFF